MLINGDIPLRCINNKFQTDFIFQGSSTSVLAKVAWEDPEIFLKGAKDYIVGYNHW